MTLENQILEYYLTSLSEIANISAEKNDVTDPTLYNNLFQLRKYYNEHGNIVPKNHVIYFLEAAQIMLKDLYDDYISDDGHVEFDEYISEWKTFRRYEIYGNNDCCNLYNLARNTLRDILNMAN